MNVLRLPGTTNSEPIAETPAVPGCDPSLVFLHGDRQTYAANLIRDWQAQLQHFDGLKRNSCALHKENFFRLLNHARVAPWELKKEHVTRFLESRVNKETGQALAPSTVGTYCASWRSVQNYMMEPDRTNEILSAFKVRPGVFITEENGIAVKRNNATWVPKGWALTPENIEALDETFRAEIRRAHKSHSKSLLPLQRDRVMFHVAIHYALRISELVSTQAGAFAASHDSKLAHFGGLGVLTVTGKNDVTGSVPTRDPDIHALVEWYIGSVRQKLLLRRKVKPGDKGTCKFNGRTITTGDLLFPSERGTVICPNTFRKRLLDITMKSGVISNRLTPHILRHTGCTLMVPLYSPEIAQKYMRHKHLHTTLYYYHPTPLDAANEANTPFELFDEKE